MNGVGGKRKAASAILLIACWLFAAPARTFPPYRSTDADTADPGSLEARLGVIEVERKQGQDTFTAPLLRLNLGLPGDLELTSELEYVPREDHLGDAAVGAKWVPFRGRPSFGVEASALLPVRDGDDGLGFEGQLLATLKGQDVLFHVNGGGFYDARPAAIEAGWRGSALVEFTLDGVRTGIEAFAKRELEKDVDGRIGAGVIADLGPFELRAGIHAGVTHEAPDVVVSLWIARKLQLW
jgi:hypothetical protein